ncbi:MAG: hypothetical protein K7J46_11770 [Bryobacter sp.]|jgi:hypothetical protein|nr:hypothetical protein [Bryobacter sp. CoA8 C33]
MRFLPYALSLALPLLAQDASNITQPSQADMLVGTRVPRNLEWRTPTAQERWRVLFRNLALSPGAYIRTGLTASTHHLENKPLDYGQGWLSYGKRNLNTHVTYSLQDMATAGLAASAGYEIRYIQCKCTSILPRLGHAIAFSFVTYNRQGKKVLKWPKIVGNYSVGMLSTRYTPNQKWSAQGIQMGTNAMAFGIFSSVLQEFTPSQLLFWKKKKNQAPPVGPPRPPATVSHEADLDAGQ